MTGDPGHLDPGQEQVLLAFAVPLEGLVGPMRLEDVENSSSRSERVKGDGR